MGLAAKALTAGKMLQRLTAAIRAELTAIENIERRSDDNRRVRYAVAVGFVSVAAIPASLVLAFLSINAPQVNGNWSMFSHHYLGVYLVVTGVILVARCCRSPCTCRSPTAWWSFLSARCRRRDASSTWAAGPGMSSVSSPPGCRRQANSSASMRHRR